ncbi:MAG: peptide chain release factor N(5)-glutamine methyltransferase [Flavisolibacter sp.]
MKTGEAERHIKSKLVGIYEDQEASNIAGILIEHITRLAKTERLAKKDQRLDDHQVEKMNEAVVRLQEHEPIQYVTNKAWFYGMELYVDKNVLIPRPETEELVEWIIKDVKGIDSDIFVKRGVEADDTRFLKILDIGTGSGCIALALKRSMPKAEVWGCDNSDGALNIARRNGSSLDVRVDFVGLDFLDVEQQKQLPSVDIIVSNPPYVPLHNTHKMQANVLNYEPHNALFVPDNDPLIFYKSIAAFAEKRLHANGRIYLEIHEDLGKDVVEIFEKEGYKTELRRDMQGKERMVRVASGFG